jgi:hypothetical protein
VWLVPVVPEIALLILLAWDRPRQHLEQIGRRRTVALALLAVVSLGNGQMLAALLGSLIAGNEQSGGELLLKSAAIWGTNVITFALSSWFLDRGGPRDQHPQLDARFGRAQRRLHTRDMSRLGAIGGDV